MYGELASPQPLDCQQSPPAANAHRHQIDHDSFVGSEAVWNGNWRVIPNGRNEVMKLTEDRNQNLSGTLTADNGDAYAVGPTSWHDGSAFLIVLNRPRMACNLTTGSDVLQDAMVTAAEPLTNCRLWV